MATRLNSLVAIYRVLGRFAEAEPFAKRSPAIAEKSLGAEDPVLSRREYNR